MWLFAAAAGMCAPPIGPPTLRVCTEGTCGNGAATLEHLRFLSPLYGPELVSCSCLAACDRGVAVQQRRPGREPDARSSTILERVNTPAQCAKVLQRNGYRVDGRLATAAEAACAADRQLADDELVGALRSYSRALKLASAAGLGLVQWRSRPSSVVRVRQQLQWQQEEQQEGAPRDSAAAAEGAPHPEEPMQEPSPRGASGAASSMLPSFAFLSDEQLVERARSLTEAVGEQLAGSGRRRPAEAGARDARGGGTRSTTPRQVLWLSRTLVGRSRAYARIAAQAPFVLAFEPPGVTRRRVRSALEDARYAVQLAESAGLEIGRTSRPDQPALSPEGLLAREAADALTGAWERQAEAHELARDLPGAIYAYERLLALEPPSTPGLSVADSARRGVQELVLLSHRRGVADAQLGLDRLQEAGEDTRRSLTSKGIADVESLRRLVEQDFDAVDRALAARAGVLGVAVSGTDGRASAAESGKQLDELGPLARLAAKSVEDVRVMRKIAKADFNSVQLSLLRGDPLLAWARGLASRAFGRAPPPTAGGAGAWPSESLSQGSSHALWLKEKFEQGALPRDPVLISALVEQAKQDPQLVTRLVSELIVSEARTEEGSAERRP